MLFLLGSFTYSAFRNNTPPCGLPGGVDLLCQTVCPGGCQFRTTWNIDPGGWICPCRRVSTGGVIIMKYRVAWSSTYFGASGLAAVPRRLALKRANFRGLLRGQWTCGSAAPLGTEVVSFRKAPVHRRASSKVSWASCQYVSSHA